MSKDYGIDQSVPISALNELFNRVDDSAFRAVSRLFYLEYGFTDREHAVVSMVALANHVGCTERAMSRAMQPVIKDKDKDGVTITPLVKRELAKDFGSPSYHIPAGNLLRQNKDEEAEPRTSDDKNTFSVRHFFFNAVMDQEGNTVNVLNKKSGLSVNALRMLLIVELMRDLDEYEYRKIDDFIWSENRQTVKISDSITIKRPPIKSRRSMLDTINELAAFNSPYSGNPLVELDSLSNGKAFRPFVDKKRNGNSPQDLSGGTQDLSGGSQKLTGGGSPQDLSGGSQDLSGGTQGLSGGTQKLSGGTQDLSPMTKPVVVDIQYYDRGNPKQLPDGALIRYPFSETDAPTFELSEILKAHVLMKESKGERPTSGDGKWDAFLGKMASLARTKGIGIETIEGYNIGWHFYPQLQAFNKRASKGRLDQIRSILDEDDHSQYARLRFEDEMPCFVLRINKDGLWTKDGDELFPGERGDPMSWPDAYAMLARKDWQIDAVAKPKEVDNRSDDLVMLDEVMRAIDEGIEQGREVAVQSESGKTYIFYGKEGDLYQYRLNGENLDKPVWDVCLIVSREKCKLVG